jgi:hypothetical protein
LCFLRIHRIFPVWLRNMTETRKEIADFADLLLSWSNPKENNHIYIMIVWGKNFIFLPYSRRLIGVNYRKPFMNRFKIAVN